jgi:hypothetical protein
VRELIDDIVARPAPISANRVRALLSKMINVATQLDIVGANPVVGIARPGVERRRDRMLTPDEIRFLGGVILAGVALVESVTPHARGAAIVCVTASLSTVTGIVIAAGTSDRRALIVDAVFGAVASIPAIVAANVFRAVSHR